MQQLPGWKPMTALGICLASTGAAMFGLSVLVGFIYDWLGGRSAAVGWSLISGLGYGFQLGVLGSVICVASVAAEWFVRRARACPVWGAAR